MYKRQGIVVALAALAACFGWIMVASGLVNRPWVNAYKLSIHLCIGISVFSYLLWAFIKYKHGPDFIISSHRIVSNKLIGWVFGILLVQLFLGGIMSGMKAALIYPTWPLIGDSFVPSEVFNVDNWSWTQFREYDRGSFVFSLIHFLHRNVAYLLTGLMGVYAYRYRVWELGSRVNVSFVYLLVLVLVQILLGIFTLLNSVGYIPVLWGVLHQGVAVLVLGAFLWHLFYVKRTRTLS